MGASNSPSYERCAGSPSREVDATPGATPRAKREREDDANPKALIKLYSMPHLMLCTSLPSASVTSDHSLHTFVRSGAYEGLTTGLE